jgi:hypothetical protein
MAKSITTWRKGQVTNPKGRPPINRKLTQLLKEGGQEPLYIGTETLTCEQALAHRLWTFVSTGQVQLTPQRTLEVETATEWIALAKWIYTHIDGPAKPAENGDNNITVNVIEVERPLLNE